MKTGDFSNRKAEVTTVQHPPPPPETVVRLELTLDEAKILREAAYFYWSQRKTDTHFWHNSTDLSNEQAAKVAQDMYDVLFHSLSYAE